MVSSAAYLILTILGFGLLILIHEAGHFFMAKRARIRAHHFAIGFGPILASYRPGVGCTLGSTEAATMAKIRTALAHRDLPAHVNEVPRDMLARAGVGETQYELRILPLGGFVGMAGQDDTNPGARSEDEGSFNAASLGARMWVISGGVIANLILGVVLFGVAFMHGVEFEAPTIGPLMPGSPAAKAGLQAGDTIVSIDGAPIETFTDCRIATALGGDGSPMSVVVHRPTDDGGLETVTLTVTPMDSGNGIRHIGIRPSTSLLIDPRTIRAGQRDALVSAFPGLTNALAENANILLSQANGRSVETWAMLDQAFEASAGKPVRIVAQVNEAVIDSPVIPLPPFAMTDIASGPDVIPTPEYTVAGLTPLTMIGDVQPNSAAAGKLEAGDIVVQLQGRAGPMRQEFREAVQSARGKPVACVVERGGKRREVILTVPRSGIVGVHLQLATDDNRIARPAAFWSPLDGGARPAEPTPAAGAGVQPLSRIATIDGVAVDPAQAWSTLTVRAHDASMNQPSDASSMTITVGIEGPDDEDGVRQVSLVLEGWALAAEQSATWGNPFPIDLFLPNQVVLSSDGDPIGAVAMGFRQTGAILTNVFLTLRALFRGDVGVNQLSGPVGIVHAGTIAAERSVWYLLFFLALISVNLAFLNALPIPIADGGHMVYLLWEATTGKVPSPRFQNVAALVGLTFFVGLFLLTFYNDVLRLIS
ncbi:MAG: site-2 protease family protein [Planctomycetota bacterium]|nr:site-2 protease family protein [Planctomycetota bacterium]